LWGKEEEEERGLLVSGLFADLVPPLRGRPLLLIGGTERDNFAQQETQAREFVCNARDAHRSAKTRKKAHTANLSYRRERLLMHPAQLKQSRLKLGRLYLQVFMKMQAALAGFRDYAPFLKAFALLPPPTLT
jgi:hypothetical protein